MTSLAEANLAASHEADHTVARVFNTTYIRQLSITTTGQPISKSEKLVMFVLYCSPTDDSGESWVSLEDLAADSLLTQDEVIRILQGLERKAVLQMIPDDAALRMRVAPCSTIARARGVTGRTCPRR